MLLLLGCCAVRAPNLAPQAGLVVEAYHDYAGGALGDGGRRFASFTSRQSLCCLPGVCFWLFRVPFIFFVVM